MVWFGFMVFNATFNNISVLLVEEIGWPGENHWPDASHWQTWSHNVVSSTPHLSGIRTHNLSGDSHRLHRYSQTCLSDPLYINDFFFSRPYLFLPSVFPCIRPLYNDPLSNATNDRVLWVKILHITTIRGLHVLSNLKLDNK